jgi:hypothetical protein
VQLGGKGPRSAAAGPRPAAEWPAGGEKTEEGKERRGRELTRGARLAEGERKGERGSAGSGWWEKRNGPAWPTREGEGRGETGRAEEKEMGRGRERARERKERDRVLGWAERGG